MSLLCIYSSCRRRLNLLFSIDKRMCEKQTHCTNSPINSIDFLCVVVLLCDAYFIAHVACELPRHSNMFIDSNKEYNQMKRNEGFILAMVKYIRFSLIHSSCAHFEEWKKTHCYTRPKKNAAEETCWWDDDRRHKERDNTNGIHEMSFRRFLIHFVYLFFVHFKKTKKNIECIFSCLLFPRHAMHSKQWFKTSTVVINLSVHISMHVLFDKPECNVNSNWTFCLQNDKQIENICPVITATYRPHGIFIVHKCSSAAYYFVFFGEIVFRTIRNRLWLSKCTVLSTFGKKNKSNIDTMYWLRLLSIWMFVVVVCRTVSILSLFFSFHHTTKWTIRFKYGLTKDDTSAWFSLKCITFWLKPLNNVIIILLLLLSFIFFPNKFRAYWTNASNCLYFVWILFYFCNNFVRLHLHGWLKTMWKQLRTKK